MTFIKKTSLFFVALSLGLGSKIEASPGFDIFPSRMTVVQTKPADAFPPIPEDLQVGCKYSKQKVLDRLPKIGNKWYVVPKWLAGEFAYGEMEVDLVHDYSSGQTSHPEKKIAPAKSGRRRGMLVDKKGNIWQLSHGGAIGATNPGDPTYRRFDSDILGVILSPEQYMEITDSIEFHVDDASKITGVSRMQRVRNFFSDKLSPSIDAYIQEIHFDQQGHPLTRNKASGVMKKIHDFEPLTAANERQPGEYAEALQQLREYMKENGEGADAP